MSLEVMKQALEALEYFSDTSPTMAGKAHAEDAITALRQQIALEKKAENARELGLEYDVKPDAPVAWMKEVEGMRLFTSNSEIAARESMNTPLYPRPQPAAQCEHIRSGKDGTHWCALADKPAWVGLTDEEVIEFEKWLDFKEEGSGWVPPQKIVAYIEARLKEKNT